MYSKVLHPKYHDNNIRLLCRKTQFNPQLNKHSDQSHFCKWCLDNNKSQIKENMIHALWDCMKIKDLPTKVADFIIQSPLTSQQLFIYDNFCDAQTLVNSI